MMKLKILTAILMASMAQAANATDPLGLACHEIAQTQVAIYPAPTSMPRRLFAEQVETSCLLGAGAEALNESFNGAVDNVSIWLNQFARMPEEGQKAALAAAMNGYLYSQSLRVKN
ncbi:hypothetical protein ACJVQT_23140 [Enterobacter huaxiensis]|uniref:hypothetical protein n=1 Tax=Enterobacter huaxiensis TaxID=2494702 RepID=UPI002175A5CA|nr:hypothetical protein [Enterobacter huaxiensis]MCS5452474.1 hypothetical protein [Enterobacter huaxiensis]